MMLSRRVPIALAMIAGLCACSDNNDYEYAGGRTALDMRVGAQETIKGKLRDPDSAEFSEVHISAKSGMHIVCGKVNSRNGFGGMGGAQYFISNGVNLAFLEEEVGGDGWAEVWNRYC